jgi:hypothetical protein
MLKKAAVLRKHQTTIIFTVQRTKLLAVTLMLMNLVFESYDDKTDK